MSNFFQDERTQSTPLDPKLLFCTIWVHLGPLRCLTKLGAKHSELVQKFVPRSRFEVYHDKRTRSTPLDPKLMFWCVLYHFGAFGTILLPISEQNKVASEFFTTKAPDPPHWTLNSCFDGFPTIWVHLGPFGCLTKLGAKRAELVQKFVPRSCIGIFRNERTRSTPLDPKLMFCCISYHLGAFGTVWLPYKTCAKRAEVVQKFVSRS